MNLEELIKKYLGEHLDECCMVKITYCHEPASWEVVYERRYQGGLFLMPAQSESLEKAFAALAEKLRE